MLMEMTVLLRSAGHLSWLFRVLIWSWTFYQRAAFIEISFLYWWKVSGTLSMARVKSLTSIVYAENYSAKSFCIAWMILKAIMQTVIIMMSDTIRNMLRLNLVITMSKPLILRLLLSQYPTMYKIGAGIAASSLYFYLKRILSKHFGFRSFRSNLKSHYSLSLQLSWNFSDNWLTNLEVLVSSLS